MPKKKYLVKLSEAEREQLEQMLRSGKHASRKITRARILLKVDGGCTEDETAEGLDVGRVTVEPVRQRLVTRGLEALNESPRPGHSPKLDAKAEARLIAEACSTAPEGRQRWTLQLLADRVVQLGLAESCAYEAVRGVLKKTNSSRD